jgi:glycine/D-amino acid oxidase-like deaminating enzyme
LATTLALLKAAQNLGANLLAGQAVSAMDVSAGRVTGVITSDGRLTADMVVIAAGAQTAALAATADIAVPMQTPPGLLVATRPLAKILNGLVMAPEMHVRQLDDGRLLAGADFGGTDPGADAAATAQDVFQGLQRLLQGGTAFAFDRYQIGYRPMPLDGFPIVGPAKAGLYLAVTHSGITLAPIIGAAAAQEILSNAREPLLAPYRWTRFVT